MKISVIIPVYNIATYLERCVRCVLGQTYSDLEVILVDDGATDGSGEMCDNLSQTDERIVVVHKENGGLSDARNAGISKATGQYIHFLDGDDYYNDKNVIEQLVAELVGLNYPEVLLFCRTDVYANSGHVKDGTRYNVDYINNAKDSVTVFDHLLSTQRFNMSACFQLLSRDLIVDNSIYFEKGLLSEDVDWSMNLWRHVSNVKASNIHGYSYFHRSNSITTTFSLRSLDSYAYLFKKWTNILEGQEGDRMSTLQLQYLAFLYPTLLYNYYLIPKSQRGEAQAKLRAMQYVLKYSNTVKSDRVGTTIKLMGFRLSCYLWGVYGILTKKLRTLRD